MHVWVCVASLGSSQCSGSISFLFPLVQACKGKKCGRRDRIYSLPLQTCVGIKDSSSSNLLLPSLLPPTNVLKIQYHHLDNSSSRPNNIAVKQSATSKPVNKSAPINSCSSPTPSQSKRQKCSTDPTHDSTLPGLHPSTPSSFPSVSPRMTKLTSFSLFTK